MAERLFQLNEGDLWRFQLETMAELAKFIKAHPPGKPCGLPTARWDIDNGFHAVTRLSSYTLGADGTPVDQRAVLAAYAAALGTEVTSIDLGDGDTEYRVNGALGERGRVKLILIATVRAQDHRADTGQSLSHVVDAVALGLPPIDRSVTHYTTSSKADAACGADWDNGTVSPYADNVTCPQCKTLIAETEA
jgi:hypothetical protein